MRGRKIGRGTDRELREGRVLDFEDKPLRYCIDRV